MREGWGILSLDRSGLAQVSFEDIHLALREGGTFAGAFFIMQAAGFKSFPDVVSGGVVKNCELLAGDHRGGVITASVTCCNLLYCAVIFNIAQC